MIFDEKKDSLFLSATNVFPTRKYEIAKFTDNIISELLDDGEIPLLQVESKLACMASIVKNIRDNKEYKEALLNEAEREGLKTFKKNDSSFCIKEVGTVYDFSDCGHLEYNSIILEIKALTERKKAIEGQIKANPRGYIYVNDETGESYFVKPCSKTSTTQVVTTISQ
jgi:hypothetical protein